MRAGSRSPPSGDALGTYAGRVAGPGALGAHDLIHHIGITAHCRTIPTLPLPWIITMHCKTLPSFVPVVIALMMLPPPPVRVPALALDVSVAAQF